MEDNCPVLPAWLENNDAFIARFGITYDDFCKLATAIGPDKIRDYELIQKANEEAAILWLIQQGRDMGYLQNAS
jgi:hypothetical protein